MLRADLVTIAIAVTANYLLVALKDSVGVEVAGLALAYVNGETSGAVGWCVRQYAETENVMTSIERLFQFAKLPSEGPLNIKSKEQPRSEDRGVIEFRNVKVRYDPASVDYVLHGLSFKTVPSEKIGIVGRTGAGKSTILQALFRMIEPEGEILLEGVLTSEMGLQQLRKSISTIPQESLLFTETLRINLDPFSEFSDEEIWNSLEKVELKSYVTAQLDGLGMMIQEGGGNLSAGQRQLLCLARALLRDNRFLVIDEATANVDEVICHAILELLVIKYL